MDWGDFLAPWVPQLIQIIHQVAFHEVAVFELGIVRNLILPYVCRHIYIYIYVCFFNTRIQSTCNGWWNLKARSFIDSGDRSALWARHHCRRLLLHAWNGFKHFPKHKLWVCMGIQRGMNKSETETWITNFSPGSGWAMSHPPCCQSTTKLWSIGLGHLKTSAALHLLRSCGIAIPAQQRVLPWQLLL